MAETRQKAQALILAGLVSVDGRRADKAGSMVPPDAVIEVRGEAIPFVSRGGLKLDAALDAFGIDVSCLVCADFGASTGGFTDCLLKRGAARVYAVDVGYGQLDLRLRDDPRVVVLDRTNVRLMGPDDLGENPDMAVVDLSFISLRLVLGNIMSILRPAGYVVALVKPQFEVGKGRVGKGGIVRDEAERLRAVRGIEEFARGMGFDITGILESPVKGAKGNVEYLLCMRTPGVRPKPAQAG
jgi:23S rRNA (cytidine1920-2'-O)/16S rRNA (cytidine1409-2'-O)-methyltransferase